MRRSRFSSRDVRVWIAKAIPSVDITGHAVTVNIIEYGLIKDGFYKWTLLRHAVCLFGEFPYLPW